jgi:hypothetical protein
LMIVLFGDHSGAVAHRIVTRIPRTLANRSAVLSVMVFSPAMNRDRTERLTPASAAIAYQVRKSELIACWK